MGVPLLSSSLLLLSVLLSHPTPVHLQDPLSMSADWMTAFGANYGNAIAESMGETEGRMGATGMIDNMAAYNLRLVRCINVIGGMAQHFPLIISPGSENAGISGYAKKSKNQADPNKPSGQVLEQKCLYAVYDAAEKDGVWTELGLHNKNDNPGKSTQYIEFYFKVSENGGNDVGVTFAPNVVAAAQSGGTWMWGKDAQISKVGTSGHKKTASMHRCSKFNDVCVEATIGTGYKPRFRFVIMPMKLADLTPKDRGHYNNTGDGTPALVGGRTEQKLADSEYCQIMGSYFGYVEDSDQYTTIYQECLSKKIVE